MLMFHNPLLLLLLLLLTFHYALAQRGTGKYYYRSLINPYRSEQEQYIGT